MIWRSSPLEKLPLEATLPVKATLPQPSPCAGGGPDLEEIGGAGRGPVKESLENPVSSPRTGRAGVGSSLRGNR